METGNSESVKSYSPGAFATYSNTFKSVSRYESPQVEMKNSGRDITPGRKYGTYLESKSTIAHERLKVISLSLSKLLFMWQV